MHLHKGKSMRRPSLSGEFMQVHRAKGGNAGQPYNSVSLSSSSPASLGREDIPVRHVR